jgi:chloramphenicol O-acetyltransferase type B
VLKAVARRVLLWWQTTVQYRFRAVGRDCRLGRGLFVMPRRVSLGDRVYIGQFSYLDGDITIGSDVLLAGSVAIVGGDHVFRVPGVKIRDGGREHWRPTRIGDDVWIGHGAIILNGTSVGKGAVVAAGSVVTRDVPPFVVVAGNPARVLGPRYPDAP